MARRFPWLRLIIAIGAIATAVIVYAITTLWWVSNPSPPARSIADSLISAFPGNEAALRSIAALEDEKDSLSVVRYGGAADSATGVERFWRRERMIDSLRATLHPLDRGNELGWGTARSRTHVYISIWASRGSGFDAPWWHVGYVYSTNGPPGWDLAGLPRYRHLDGDWYLFSLDESEPHNKQQPW